MNPKVTAIILFVIGAGIALYIFNSGGAARLASVFKTPGSSSTTAAVGSSSTESSTGASSTLPKATSSALSNFFSQFFSLVFRGPATSTYGPPTLSSGLGEPGGGENYSGSGNNGSQTYISSGSSGSGSTGASATSSIPAYEIPAGYTLAQLSPYFHQIVFGGVSSYEISLYYTYGYGQPTSSIDITGWQIKTNRGGEYIPQAVNIYNPAGVNPTSDIILTNTQNDTVNLYSNSAPTNVRLNSCMGYLGYQSQFNPELPNVCPEIDRSAISNFSGQCQNYIWSLGNCQPVDMSNPEIPRTDYACQQYLENNFTYDSCITNHDHDANFLSNEWYVWMGSTPLDPYHDNVVLLDRNGLVVDSYSY